MTVNVHKAFPWQLEYIENTLGFLGSSTLVRTTYHSAD